MLGLKETGLAQYISILLLAGLVSFNPNMRELTFRDQSKNYPVQLHFYTFWLCYELFPTDSTADPPLSTPLSQIAPVLNNNISLEDKMVFQPLQQDQRH